LKVCCPKVRGLTGRISPSGTPEEVISFSSPSRVRLSNQPWSIPKVGVRVAEVAEQQEMRYDDAIRAMIWTIPEREGFAGIESALVRRPAWIDPQLVWAIKVV
jgi:hypothetical protein